MRPLFTDIFDSTRKLSGFDIIYTLLTLHHIKDINRTFGIFNSALNIDGYLCIGDLITEDGSFHHKDPEFDGYNGFDPGELKKLLLLNGFRIEFESTEAT